MKELDGVLLKRMITSGANNLYNSYPEIDALNVFPVPDGDTGTNMNLTMASGVKEVFDVSKGESLCQVAKNFATGLLIGARGNSGVILSQIFLGFSESVKDKEKINALEFASAFAMGKDTGYKAVVRPVEGTILTIIREASEALLQKVERNMHIDECMDIIYEEAKKSLERTPELLPVLKEVGVVDSGGAGLCKVLEGFARALHNDIVEKDMGVSSINIQQDQVLKNTASIQSKFEHDEFGYCTQFMLNVDNNKRTFNEKRFKSVLSAHGNSIVMAVIDNLVKVHIHTLTPGVILTYAQQFGEFKMIKIDNMAEQHEEILLNDIKNGNKINKENKLDAPLKARRTAPENEKPTKEIALIAVGVGKGIENLFKSSNVDYIINGGQTMNPSTGDFVYALKDINAKNVIILPNNSNIIMSAKQACDIVKDKYNVKVLETKSVSEGLIACVCYNPDASVDENIDNMLTNLENVKCGEVTYAIKDTSFEGVEVKKGHFMGLGDKKIYCSDKDKFKVLINLIKKLKGDNSQIVTIICGEDIDEKAKEKVKRMFAREFDENEIECELLDGGQPLFSFYVSVE